MGLYYGVCGLRSPTVLFVITVVLNVILQILFLILGLTDPGIIPKIYG